MTSVRQRLIGLCDDGPALGYDGFLAAVSSAVADLEVEGFAEDDAELGIALNMLRQVLAFWSADRAVHGPAEGDRVWREQWEAVKAECRAGRAAELRQRRRAIVEGGRG